MDRRYALSLALVTVIFAILITLGNFGVFNRVVLAGGGTPVSAAISPGDSEWDERAAVVFPLNINTATERELTALPGIGEVLAGRIAGYREQNGPFASPEEIMGVVGIGEKIYGDLKDLITTE